VRQLGDFLAAVPDFGVRGFSVTLPNKQAILKHLKECDPLAAEIGAVNTVVVHSDGSLHGSNTDYVGVLRALEKKLQIKGSRALILGAGGSARAAAFALSRAGAIVEFAPARESGERTGAGRGWRSNTATRFTARHSFDAVLNATPVGMHPRGGISPLAPGELPVGS